MKKLIVVLMAVLCVAALAPRDLSAGVGIKGGLSLSKFSLTGEMDDEAHSVLDSLSLYRNFGKSEALK